MRSDSIASFFETRDIAVYTLNGALVWAALPDHLSEDVLVYLRENEERVREFVAGQPFHFYHSPLFNGKSPCLARFRAGLSGSLFCIHPASGGSWCFRQIVGGFLLDYTIYGVYAPGFCTTWRPLSFCEMALAYTEQIVQKHPTGPYWICGYSMGGILALDVARLLRERGADVRPVCVIDSRLLDGVAARAARLASDQIPLFMKLPLSYDAQPLHVWRFFAGVYFGWEIARSAIVDPTFLQGCTEARLNYLLEQGRRRNILNHWWRAEDVRAIFAFQTSLLRQAGEYRSEVFDGPVAYFFSEQGMDQTYAVEFLNLVRGGHKLVQCPGDHISMIFDAENAFVLGRRISSYIAEYEGRLAGGSRG